MNKSVLDKLVKVFRYLFPEFSNKVTWIVVIGGLSLTSSSIVQNLINEFAKREYDIQLFDEFDSIAGVALVALGLLHNILLQREKTKIEVVGKAQVETAELKYKREHDIKLFEKLTKDFEEFHLTEFISSLEGDHSFLYSEKNRLKGFMYAYEEAENQFLTESVNDRFQEFGQCLEVVMRWCSLHFFSFPENVVMEDQRYCLYPDLRNGGRFENIQLYDERANELIALTKKLTFSYKQFRAVVKQELYI
ncbi:hypothetical protein ACXHP7_21950 [Vibrio chemaguriensis]